MPCSPAQLEANRRNSLKSTGPTSPGGKAQSRRNALKHGLTGEGIALPTEDAAEVERRFEALEAEMNPNGELARLLVKRVAFLSCRLERCARDESKRTAHRMRHAEEQYVDQRLAEVEKAFSWLATEPATGARRLRNMPEGIDLLVGCFERLKAELENPHGVRWGWTYCEQVHHMMGRRRFEVPVTRVRALSDAIEGNFTHLDPTDGGDLADLDRRGWAAGMMIKLIEDEIATLKALRANLDHETLELDRVEAPERVMFDPSPAATLARKYEATAERGFFRALREFREVQAETPPPASDAPPEPAESEPIEESGSFFPINVDEPEEVEGLSQDRRGFHREPAPASPLATIEAGDDGPSDLGPPWR